MQHSDSSSARIDPETGEILDPARPQSLETTTLVVDSSLPTDNDDLDIDPFEPTITGRIEHHKAGRKSKLTPRFIKKFEALLALGNYPDRVCAVMGISRQSYYRYMTAGREIDDQFEELNQGDMFDFEKPEDRLAALNYLGYPMLDILKYDFFKMVIYAEATAEARLAGIVFKASNQDPYLAKQMLESRFPQRWGKKRVELTGPDGGPLELEAAPTARGNMTENEVNDELERLLAKANVKRLQAGND